MVSYKNDYLLFGNPVKQSKSPDIYNLFSIQTKMNLNYGTYNILEKNNFSSIVSNFFRKRGVGANITVPFKEEAYYLSNFFTKRALISKSINTLKKNQDGKIIADNTDGIGLLYDLKRLNFIKYKARILLIGSGGVVKSIIPDLLLLNCCIDIVNRTISRAQKLSFFFRNLGCINVLDIKFLQELNYDLVINATSIDIKEDFNLFNSNIKIYPYKTYFYDICYNNNLTSFLRWCKKKKNIFFSDGIGMLVTQAAHAFYFWKNIFPDVISVINILNKNKKYNYIT